MADSISQQIMTAMDARFRTITKANGYKTNAGLHVFDWEDRDLADSELEAIIYRDPSNMRTQNTIIEFDNKKTVEVEVKTKAGSDTPRRIREMIEDVYKAIGTSDTPGGPAGETWGGLADCTQSMGEKIDVQKSEKISGSAQIIMEIEYRTEKWQY